MKDYLATLVAAAANPIQVAVTGAYRLAAQVYGPLGDTGSDSFFVQVDGAPYEGYLREDGTRLDKLALERVEGLPPEGQATAYYFLDGQRAAMRAETRQVWDAFEYTDAPTNHDWTIYVNTVYGQVSTVSDATRGGRVLRTEAKLTPSTDFGMRLPASGSLDDPHTHLSVWIKDTDDFSFCVRVLGTDDNEYIIVYKPTSGSPYAGSGNYAWIPVGTQFQDGIPRGARDRPGATWTVTWKPTCKRCILL